MISGSALRDEKTDASPEDDCKIRNKWANYKGIQALT